MADLFNYLGEGIFSALCFGMGIGGPTYFLIFVWARRDHPSDPECDDYSDRD